jgi:membrane fusion protein, multidrug efflux system
MHFLPSTALVAAVLLASLLGACGKSDKAAPAQRTSAASTPATLLLAPEDLMTVALGQEASGPVITGSVQPERRADLRAEVAAVVMQVLKDNGESVRAGDLLMRLDDTAIRESLTSAEESQRAASQALEQAERQVQRLKTLQAQGMATTQSLEDAEVRRNNAQSDSVSARSRVATARQQLQRTLVRAPFDGIVSDRKASAGDTAQIGKELVKVIDPRSMRFEGLVSADHLDALKIGQAVSFRINGFGDDVFAGKVQRIDAAVNAATRQVGVVVGFADPARAPRVAGLFAEGRIEGTGEQVLTVPEGPLVRTGQDVHVWRVNGSKIAKVALKLGDRNARTGEYPVLGGLSAGDRLLAHPGSSLVDGQAFEFAAVPTAPSASASAAPSATGVTASAASSASAVR